MCMQHFRICAEVAYIATFFCVCAYVYMDCPADQAFIQYLDYDLYAVGGIMQGLVICSASPPSLWCERYCALAMGAKPGSSLDTRVAKTETNSNPTSKKARKGTETLFPFNITRSDGCWRDTYFHTKEVQRVRFFHEIQYNKHFFLILTIEMIGLDMTKKLVYYISSIFVIFHVCPS